MEGLVGYARRNFLAPIPRVGSWEELNTHLREQCGKRRERDAAMLMAEKIPGIQQVTLGGKKNYDTQEFIGELRRIHITPRVAQNKTNRSSAIDEQATRHASADATNTGSNQKEGTLFGFFADEAAASRAMALVELSMFKCYPHQF